MNKEEPVCKGIELANLGRFEEALKEFGKVIELQPDKFGFLENTSQEV